ncbi:2-dehydropantoate 2-reductase [Halobacillus salinus]|uniref:2-dehydropantoate 2-reductase n=1 Tax=Halobacillus salinus TaxID=192814 RepID=UPI0009A7516B|nr:2-dehydropantoate 2-reductase [Halobacillus salinus]
MDIAIVGGGAIGLLTGAYLGRDHMVHMYVRREEQAEQLKQEGISCSSLEGAVPVHSHLVTEGFLSHDLVIIAVKQDQVPSVLQEIRNTNSSLLFLQNGMAHLELIPDYSNALIGVVDHGALKIDDRTVEHLGKGTIQVAPFKKGATVQSLVDELCQEDFPVLYRKDYQKLMVAKLVVNTVINPLTALFEVRNKQINDNPSIQRIAYTLCEEVCGVFNLPHEEEWERVRLVAERTGENESSMFKDIKAGRKTEIDAISGYVLRKSNRDVPYHQFVVDAIHAKERRGS